MFTGEYTRGQKGGGKKGKQSSQSDLFIFLHLFAPAKAHLPGSFPRLGPCNSHGLQLSGSIDNNNNNNNSIDREESVSREWKENNR